MNTLQPQLLFFFLTSLTLLSRIVSILPTYYATVCLQTASLTCRFPLRCLSVQPDKAKCTKTIQPSDDSTCNRTGVAPSLCRPIAQLNDGYGVDELALAVAPAAQQMGLKLAR